MVDPPDDAPAGPLAEVCALPRRSPAPPTTARSTCAVGFTPAGLVALVFSEEDGNRPMTPDAALRLAHALRRTVAAIRSGVSRVVIDRVLRGRVSLVTARGEQREASYFVPTPDPGLEPLTLRVELGAVVRTFRLHDGRPTLSLPWRIDDDDLVVIRALYPAH